jgi:hypothetical protein
MTLDPVQKITYSQRTASGKSFQCGRRTGAHLDSTKQRLARVRPGSRMSIIQGCYNTGVEASVGTHDFDAVLDVIIFDEGGKVDWDWSQHFLRRCGWAAWHRTPAQGFSPHIHQISLGYAPAPVGIFVPGQVDDYYRHALGLKGQHDSGDDPSWHPADIDATIFNYAEWEDDDMPYRDWPQADKDALTHDVAERVGPVVVAAIIAHVAEARFTNPIDPTKPKWSADTLLGSIHRLLRK